MTSSVKAARLCVDKNPSMVDEPIRISLQNVAPFQEITMIGKVREPIGEFVSYAHVIADTHGTVDLCTHPSLGGTYRGIDGMGLLWSMVASRETKPGARIMKKLADTPFFVQLAAMDGHHNVKSWSDVTDKLCTTEIQRWYEASDTDRIKITAGRLRGMMFVPKTKAKAVGIIDLFGSTGGLMEFRGALLSSHGFTVLSLAYFNYEDLPKGIEFDLDYFDEAVKFMMSHPRVDSSQGLGILGSSKGAEIALHVTSHNTDVKACVSINSGTYQCYGVHTYKGAPINVHMYDDWSRIVQTDEGLKLIEAHRDVDNKADLIPVQQAKHANFMIIAGHDDTNICASNSLRTVRRIRESGNEKCVLKLYPGAGHLLEPPYMPLCRVGYFSAMGECLVYGGEPRLHADAQTDMWRSILAFFKTQFRVNYERVGRLPPSKI